MITALAGTLAVLGLTGSGPALGGGFGVGPMAVTAIVGALSSAPAATKTEVAGVLWHDSVDAALAEGKRLNKPVFIFQLFGKIDDAFC